MFNSFFNQKSQANVNESLANVTASSAGSNIDQDYILRGVIQKTAKPTDTIDDVLKAADMSFDWEKVGQSYQWGDKVMTSESMAVIRKDTGFQLGTVGKNYQPKSYREAFDKVFPFMVEHGGIPARAIAFHGGRRGAIQFIVPSEDRKVGGSTNQLWITLTNSFDGTSGLGVASTTVTIVCGNTFNAVMRSLDASVKHTRNVDTNLSKLTAAMKAIRADYQKFQDDLCKLYDTKVTAEESALFAKVLFPVTSYTTKGEPNKTAGNDRALLDSNIKAELLENDSTLTLGSLFGAVTRMVDHDKVNPKDSLADQWLYASGSGQKIKNEALEVLNWPIARWQEVYKGSIEYSKSVSQSA